MTEAPVREGEVLAGKYRVERVLGVGGMGVVVAATHLQLDQRVALKFLLPSALSNVDVVTRFAREARAAAKIESEHVARVLDVGTLESGSPYMVMEYLQGKDLADTLAERGPLSVTVAVKYVLQACEALAEAHTAGVVHRDLKPANLFLAKRAARGEIIKVLDFGIAKALVTTEDDTHDAGLTRTAALLGSPLYMSPEQLTTPKDVDGRTDLWSLGVILYQLVSGRMPYNADTMPALIAQILSTEPQALGPPSDPPVPEGFNTVVMRCLRKNRNERYANILQLAQALGAFASPNLAQTSIDRISRVFGDASERQAAGTSPANSAVRIASTGDTTVDAFGGTHAGTNARHRVGIAVVAAAVAAAGVGTVWLVRRNPAAPVLPTIPTLSVPVVAASTPAAAPALPEGGAAPAESSAPASAPSAPGVAGTSAPTSPAPAKRRIPPPPTAAAQVPAAKTPPPPPPRGAAPDTPSFTPPLQ